MPRFTKDRKAKFVEHLRRTGNVYRTCEAIGVHKTTAYTHRKGDPKFAAEWDEAYREHWDQILDEAKRRAINGVERPIIWQGVPQYRRDHNGDVVRDGQGRPVPLTVTEYSDRLLQFLIEKGHPDFRWIFNRNYERPDELPAPQSAPSEFPPINVDNLDSEEKLALSKLLAKCEPVG